VFYLIDRVDFLYFFGPVRSTSVQLTSFPPFSLSGAVSPPANIITQAVREAARTVRDFGMQIYSWRVRVDLLAWENTAIQRLFFNEEQYHLLVVLPLWRLGNLFLLLAAY
jgi:hypothetical protein